MASVNFKRRNTVSDLDNIPIEDGNFIVTKDGHTFVDFDNDRVGIGGTPDLEMSDSSENSVQNKVVKEYVDNVNEKAANNLIEIENIKNSKNFISKEFTNKSCTKNSTNSLATLTLTKGIWVVVGSFGYNGSNLRYYLNIDSYGLTSAYDNNGNVAGNVTAIINVTKETQNISLFLWPTDKDITVSGNLRAVKYT